MLPKKAPFNLDLILPDRDYVRRLGLKQVTSLQILDPATKSFHPEGLYSTEIFGVIGSEERRDTFGYIDLKVPILHPAVFKALVELKKLYNEIMAGKSFARLEEIKKEYDFVRSNVLEGETGFEFFLSNIENLKLDNRNSDKREHNIKLINKYKGKYFIDKCLVLPAWYREYEQDEEGNPSDPEINEFYRKILSASNLVDESQVRNNIKTLDTIRYRIQMAVYNLYEFILDFMKGKKGFLMGKVARRNIQYSSRNVITAMSIDQQVLGDKNSPSSNDTILGIHQYAVNTLPILVNRFKTGILSNIFSDVTSPAFLIDPKTFRRTSVNVKAKTKEDWLSKEGIEKLTSTLIQEELRHKPVMVEGYYLALIYQDDKYVKVVYDIESIPSEFDKKKIRPITLGELFYMTMSQYSKKFYGFVTRYPVVAEGGVYPTKVFLVSTIPNKKLEILDNSWSPSGVILPSFPIIGERYYNSATPAVNHLGKLGADHDGDTIGTSVLMTEEANEEIKKLLGSKKYYVGADGSLNYSASVDVAEFTLSYMVG